VKKKFWKKALILLIFFSIVFGGKGHEAKETPQIETYNTIKQETEESIKEPETAKDVITSETKEETEEEILNEEVSVIDQHESFEGYKIIEVDGGNLSGYREPNVAVDVGFGDREYWI
jgi:predicted double-glycine peptidase